MARIAPRALFWPAASLPNVEVAALAARDPERARAAVRRYRIPLAHTSYEQVIADPSVDAVYIPLPNAIHAEWTLRALRAGKHVLCEKPLTANAHEAEAVAETALRQGRVVVEGFAYRYHPMADRLRALVASGEIGDLRRVEADFLVAVLRRSDIRWRFDLAGGSLMDAGCYPVSLTRWLVGSEPEVVSARTVLAAPQVDRMMEAELRFPGGVTARVRSALLSRQLLRSTARLIGSVGHALVLNPYHPSFGNLVIVHGRRGRRLEVVPGDNVYRAQLRSFAAIVAGVAENRSDASDSLGTMRVLDAIYRAAGLRPRQGTAAL